LAKTVTHRQSIVAGREKHLADLRARCQDDPEDSQAWLAMARAYDDAGQAEKEKLLAVYDRFAKETKR
jgi:cytochrome c-type biogenesis protein CcmH/NrfG